MYVNVDPAAGTATLEDAEVFTAFHVCAPDGLPVADVVAALGELGKACDADEHVWVSATGVRALAAGSSNARVRIHGRRLTCRRSVRSSWLRDRRSS